MQKIRVKFDKQVDWLKGDSVVTIEMSYDIVTGWRAQPHFGTSGHASAASNLRFRILTAHGLDLTTVLAMEHPEIFKAIQLECLHRMEALEGVPAELATDLRRADPNMREYARA
jgi:hypothetical protein